MKQTDTLKDLKTKEDVYGYLKITPDNNLAMEILDLINKESNKREVEEERRRIATAAMQGILSANAKDTWGNIDIPVPSYVAELSIGFADELIKALNK